jgi:hypothetical protein
MKVAIQNVCAVVVQNLFVPTTTKIENDAPINTVLPN